MSTWRHLYNPSTDTHYSNGGFVSPDSAVPFEGGQWIEGYHPDGAVLFQPISTEGIQQEINDLVEGINDDVQLRYSGEMALISTYMDKNNLGKAVSLLGALVTKMNAASDTEGLAAAQPVVDYLKQLGMLS